MVYIVVFHGKDNTIESDCTWRTTVIIQDPRQETLLYNSGLTSINSTRAISGGRDLSVWQTDQSRFKLEMYFLVIKEFVPYRSFQTCHPILNLMTQMVMAAKYETTSNYHLNKARFGDIQSWVKVKSHVP